MTTTTKARPVAVEKEKTEQAVAKIPDNAVAVVDWESESGAGFENTTGDDFAIPFLTLLQKGSPQVDPDDGGYIKGAQVGQLLDAATSELFSTVDVIPCHYRRSMVVWRPNQGGFVRQEAVGYEANLPRRKREDGSETGVYVDADGNDVVDTRYFFCLRLGADGTPHPVVLSLSSTQTKKARTWLTRMQGLKAVGASGHRFTLPMFAHVWRISSVPEQNDRGSWRGYKIDLVGPVTDTILATAAKDARVMFQSVAGRVKPPAEEAAVAESSGGKPAGGPDDNIPY